jgi:hypothetical protein
MRTFIALFILWDSVPVNIRASLSNDYSLAHDIQLSRSQSRVHHPSKFVACWLHFRFREPLSLKKDKATFFFIADNHLVLVKSDF